MTSSYEDSIWEMVADEERALPAALTGRAEAFLAQSQAVLDLGCGDGQYLALLARHCERVLGADRSSVALDRAATRAPNAELSLVEDDHRLPIADNSVDRVWCVDTIEHVVDTQVFLSEARRVLVPGGRLFVATPSHPWRLRFRLAFAGWEQHFDPFSPHLRFYTANSLRSSLNGGGFNVDSVEARGGLLVADALRG